MCSCAYSAEKKLYVDSYSVLYDIPIKKQNKIWKLLPGKDWITKHDQEQELSKSLFSVFCSIF